MAEKLFADVIEAFAESLRRQAVGIPEDDTQRILNRFAAIADSLATSFSDNCSRLQSSKRVKRSV